MDLIALLPLECLRIILQTLAHQNLVTALATLLRVNTYIATITLPYLYSEPFRKTFHSWKLDQGSKFVTTDHLLRMLLARRAVEDIPNVVSLSLNIAAYRNAVATIATSLGPLDYIAHIRHLSLEEWAFSEHPARFFSKSLPQVQEFIDGPEFAAVYRLDQYLPRFDSNFHQAVAFEQCFREMLHREATWTLANPILEQLQTLSIPASDITRYIGVIDRLERLECVRFIMIKIFDHDLMDISRAPEKLLVETRERQDMIMESLVRFVELHTQMFKGKLKTATCPSSNNFIWVRQACPEDIQFQFLRFLPPLPRPTTLDANNLLQFVANPLATDLGHVHKITLSPLLGTLHDRLYRNRQFLQRCRVLKSLNMNSLGKGSFNWAVQEKRIMDGMDTTLAGGQGSLLLDDERPACLRHGLVPLEEVWIRHLKEGSTDEVDDIAIGFSQTLKKLDATASDSSESLPPMFHFGRGWFDLLALVQLSLDTNTARLFLDREALMHCPNLVYVLLSDKTFDYQCQELEPHPPTCLPQLVTLRLSGWSALTFHPDTLYSTPLLETLNITMFTQYNEDDNEMHCFVPPVEDLRRSYNIQDEFAVAGSTTAWQVPQIARPCWTWSWQLPHIVDIRLCSEFAYLFEFRMLRGCPALEKLDLNMLTAGEEHTRVLSEFDIFVPASMEDAEDSVSTTTTTPLSSAPPERIIAPVLRDLSLIGKWIINDSFLFEFLAGTFPKLECIVERGWIGFTLGGLLNVARTAPQQWKHLDLSLSQPTQDESADLGIQNSAASCLKSIVLSTILRFDDQIDDFSILKELS
ncbi:hypothetical protein BGZ95_007813 [Linnemannia exigua]|uniref:F-box domain-containing protein n=1 Tax=Linnemannia exigua TaxID=604196 RepID=A0AAD4DER6_9FUNG|nr:hypothetical protein BGZ95_007813 [Linnemannia exigua]